MYTDDVNTFVKNKKELKTLIQNVIIFSQDIKIKSGIEKWAVPIMNRRKKSTEGIELPNQEIIRNTWEFYKQLPSNKLKYKKK